jgi:hypothetical protein
MYGYDIMKVKTYICDGRKELEDALNREINPNSVIAITQNNCYYTIIYSE